MSFRNPAREIAQALRHTHNGKQIPASPVASIPERGSHDTSLEQPSLTINAKASEPNNISSHRGDLRLPGEAGLGPNLQATLKHNDTHRWMAKQPTIRTNHELGVSRPRWQSFDGVSLENRYGDQNASRFFTVMLDPGHGGSDPGATGHNGILEKEVTLDIARRTALLFSESDNIRIVMTRQIDRGMSRAARVAEIKASQADMVVSLHLNHLPQTDVTLVETFYAGPENIRESQSLQRQQASANGLIKSNTSPRVDLSFTQSSKILAQLVQRRVFGEVKLTNDTASSAGVKENTLFVLTRSFTPGALIEMTALSNIAEAERLATEDYRNRLAAALAKGIQDYINTEANDPNRSSI
ncbi:MAG: N-acetylmuramoyl-L-alanine amidase [Gammaproteobacteria bacterium]|nr:N-acetylmuramoyl-L-alanine amidase [Gammaproteobacteria bacterium]